MEGCWYGMNRWMVWCWPEDGVALYRLWHEFGAGDVKDYSTTCAVGIEQFELMLCVCAGSSDLPSKEYFVTS